MVYSPPRYSVSVIGSVVVAAYRPDVFDLRAETGRQAPVQRLEARELESRLDEVGVATDAGEIDRARQARARVGEDRVVDGVMEEARDDLADSALPAFAEQQRIAQVRVALDELGRVVHRVEVRNLHRLVAVSQEHAREAGQRETGSNVAAGRFLRELVDVAQRALVDVHAAGDVAIEQERLGEGDLVVLGARAGLQ